MKRPLKTAGRGLGLIQSNPFSNCKRFHMTDCSLTLTRRSRGCLGRVLVLGKEPMSVSMAGAVGASPGALCRGQAK